MSFLKTVSIQHLNATTPAISLTANGSVGIGTTSPSTLLHAVTSDVVGDVFRISNGTQNLNLGVNNGSGGSYLFEVGANALRFGTNNTERMRIDSSGRVTKPNQPAFWITNFVWSTSIQRPNNGTVWTNVGNHYNNTTGIFTAPIAGFYLFVCTVQGNNPGETSGRNATYFNIKANVNGTDYGNEIVGTCAESNGTKHDQITHTVIVNLAANDTFYFNSNYGFRAVQNSYTGYLLG